ncbi:MAG: PIG-L deacetylase family protein [Nocardioidaceae bacterium]
MNDAACLTLVAFHAHPDDEALLTGGTMAKVAAQGHRVVLVVATAGEGGLTSAEFVDDLGTRRIAEVERSAAALGCSRVVLLGYGDSGMDGTGVDGAGVHGAGADGAGVDGAGVDSEGAGDHGTVSAAAEGAGASVGGARRDQLPAFAHAPVEEAAERLAEVLIEERADVVTSYDRRGGYGHPDHVQVQRVAARAAEIAGTPVVLEATVDRSKILLGLRLAKLLGRRVPEFPLVKADQVYSAPESITHRIDVRGHLDAKRASMQAHTSQAKADGADRTLAVALRLPRPVYRLVFGHEWYTERGRPAGRPFSDDVFDSVRGRTCVVGSDPSGGEQ